MGAATCRGGPSFNGVGAGNKLASSSIGTKSGSSSQLITGALAAAAGVACGAIAAMGAGGTNVDGCTAFK